jgi:5-enolpyruvylshikimate-3-phosphate synthase
MAMVLTAVALGAEGETVINGAECVSKSFPDFFDKMKSAGAKIELVKEPTDPSA